ncbi:MAG: hypothetical protein GY809_17670 [Planctomycetes bacterium]|nr:hypothetical protein [Planctomycetota bacterium]
MGRGWNVLAYPRDSDTAACPVTWCAAQGETTVLSGARSPAPGLQAKTGSGCTLTASVTCFTRNTVRYSGGGGVLLTGSRFSYMDDTKVYTPGAAPRHTT